AVDNRDHNRATSLSWALRVRSGEGILTRFSHGERVTSSDLRSVFKPHYTGVFGGNRSHVRLTAAQFNGNCKALAVNVILAFHPVARCAIYIFFGHFGNFSGIEPDTL